MKSALLLLLTFLSAVPIGQGPTTPKLAQTIPLPSVKGRFDHFEVDVQSALIAPGSM